MLRGLAMEADVAIVILSHPSRSGKEDGSGMSGSTGWSNSVRSRLYLMDGPRGEGEAPDPTTRTLRVMKSNYAASGEEITMRWHAGAFEPLAEVSPEQRAAAARTAEEAAEKVFLDLLHATATQGRSVGDKRGPNYAPARFADATAARDAGLRSKGLEAAMQRLFTKNMIHVETYGPPSKRRERLAVGP